MFGNTRFSKYEFVDDVTDQLRVAEAHIEWMRCAGGRYCNVMFQCEHCGSVDPENECHSPRPRSSEENK